MIRRPPRSTLFPLHDALPISAIPDSGDVEAPDGPSRRCIEVRRSPRSGPVSKRSEEHTSELQSPCNLVCRLLLEKKKKTCMRMPANLLSAAAYLLTAHT